MSPAEREELIRCMEAADLSVPAIELPISGTAGESLLHLAQRTPQTIVLRGCQTVELQKVLATLLTGERCR